MSLKKDIGFLQNMIGDKIHEYADNTGKTRKEKLSIENKIREQVFPKGKPYKNWKK